MAALQIGKNWLVSQHDARSHWGGEQDNDHDDRNGDGYDDAYHDQEDEDGHNYGDVVLIMSLSNNSFI